MKKLVSLLLVAVMVLSVGMVTTFAENREEKQFLYKDKFEEYIRVPEYDPQLHSEYGDYYYYDYDELYYHENDTSGETDWALIKAFTNLEPNPWEVVRVKQIGNRLLKWLYPGIGVLPYGYAVYDVVNDKCYDMESIRNPEDFEGLDVAFEELKLGLPLGDVDMDSTVSVLDATEIQRYMAQLIEVPYGYYSYIPALGDVDGDGEMTILDATALQQMLAGLDENPEVNMELVYSDFNNMYDVDTGIEKVSFEVLYNGTFDDFDDKISSSHFAVVIKSKEQYDSVFYSTEGIEDILNNAFFEDKWLVVSACMVTDAEMVAQITDLGVRNNTLFMRANTELRDTDGIMEPIAPMYYSLVAVDKSDIAEVSEIIWM